VGSDIGLSIDGVKVQFETKNDDNNKIAMFDFCQSLSKQCLVRPCPTISTCIESLEPALSLLEAMLIPENMVDKSEVPSNSKLRQLGDDDDDDDDDEDEEEVEDITFEVVVGSDGRRSNFVYHYGDDINDKVTQFCGHEMQSEADKIQCRKTLLDAVVRTLTKPKDLNSVRKNEGDIENWKAKDVSFFDSFDNKVELPVQINNEGNIATFKHNPSQNPYLEAEEFCNRFSHIFFLSFFLCFSLFLTFLFHLLKCTSQ
jgi:hypothetical protein